LQVRHRKLIISSLVFVLQWLVRISGIWSFCREFAGDRELFAAAFATEFNHKLLSPDQKQQSQQILLRTAVSQKLIFCQF